MFNAVRMDVYRLIHTKSAYVILIIAMALAIATSGMTALIRSMAADSIVETNEQVNMVSESDSEITGEYDPELLDTYRFFYLFPIRSRDTFCLVSLPD